MNITLIRIEDDGWIPTYQGSNRDRWYKPGDTIDTADFTHFEIEHTQYGDYVGCTVERSNHRVLMEILDEEGIPYRIKVWSYWTHTLYIPLEYLDHPVISEIIEGLDDYPLIDDEDHSALECELEEEYFQDSWLRGEFKLENPEGKSEDDIFQDYILAYHHLLETGNGEGIIFQTGCVPYLHDHKVKIMREFLISQLNYKPEV